MSARSRRPYVSIIARELTETNVFGCSFFVHPVRCFIQFSRALTDSEQRGVAAQLGFSFLISLGGH